MLFLPQRWQKVPGDFGQVSYHTQAAGGSQSVLVLPLPTTGQSMQGWFLGPEDMQATAFGPHCPHQAANMTWYHPDPEGCPRY